MGPHSSTTDKKDEIFGKVASSVPITGEEILSLFEPALTGIRVPSQYLLHKLLGSDGQSLPSLGPSAFQHGSAAFGSRADKKPVRPLPADFARLKCSFHKYAPFFEL